MGEEEVEQDALLQRKNGGEDNDQTDLLLTQHHGRESLSNNHHHHPMQLPLERQEDSIPFVKRLSDACYAFFCFEAEYDGDDHDESLEDDQAPHGLLEDQLVSTTRNKSDPSQAYLLSTFVSIWVLCSLWFLTGLMGPGVRSMIMMEIPVALFFLSLPLWLACQAKQGSQNAIIFLALLSSTWVLMELASSKPLALMWLGMWGSLYLVYVLLQKLTREFQRRTQGEDPPDTLFWQRLDSCLVHVLRGLGFLIVVSFIVGVVLMSMERFSVDGLFDDLMGFVIFSSMFAVPFYFLVVTILVRERPRPAAVMLGEFPSADADTQRRKVIRMARQFVLHPNDPLGEPLLLV